MNDSINSQTDNLADIVGMSAVPMNSSEPVLMIVLITLLASVLIVLLYYRFMHGFKGQLRHIAYQLKHRHLAPREAAHKIALLSKKQPLASTAKQQLKTLRFAEKPPTAQQIIEFIRHVV